MTSTRCFQLHRGARMACTALLFLLVSCAHHTGPGVEETPVNVIVQAPDLQHAIRAVALAGGVVTHELGIIRAVGATVTPAQLEVLRKVKDVRVLDNQRVVLSGNIVTAGVTS